ncbi:glycosyltransferase family 4 protein [Variovorax sp. PBL-E5]|uniref:glycosyltransferase family 4 protein n=1 Tax=Variovorax sp. PBL-E5 TaxID=434014 RepID=UPI001317E6FA|nr:glycosyltransferase family 4 protein [Variovorax sp. PBL-E5]VTU35319.1 D-inositol 3-phosphate glycosyltransferase [Variovorax sp. PBL-E5]
MKLLFSHPAGNQNVRAMLDALDRADMLARFATTLAASPHGLAAKLLPGGLRRELQRRQFDLPPEKILQHPWREVARAVCGKAGWNHWLRHEEGFASIDGVIRDFDRFVAKSLPGLHRRHRLGAVYTYEDAALDTFRAAKALGLKRVYDLPISYWETGRRLMQEEMQRVPEWAETLGGGIADSQAKLDRKTQELELADLVVVPSRFVADSLPAWASQKAWVLSPFGSPVSRGGAARPPDDPARALRVLFVGSMGQRKGLADLFAAMRLLKGENIELIVMGAPQTDLAFYRRQYDGFTHEGGRPHAEVLALMRSCDVFCLPSLYEGRALVMQEAMSQGLPVVITPNTGGDDLVIDGRTGFLVPIRAPEAIAEKLAWFNQNRQALPAMREAAVQHAATYTWKHYGDVVVDAIRQLA